MAKTAVFGAIHVVIAFSVTYALTGNVWAASAVTLVEPAVNMVAHYFFDKHWDEAKVNAWFARRAVALRRCFTWNSGEKGKGATRALRPEAVA